MGGCGRIWCGGMSSDFVCRSEMDGGGGDCVRGGFGGVAYGV